MMLISEFSKATTLPVDTIRFYIAKGLLKPQRSRKGGANPYQVFSDDDIVAARMIRLQQTLGYSLREIQALNEQYRAGENSSEQTIEVLKAQIGRLEERKAAIDTALTFLRDKVEWIAAGKPGGHPSLDYFLC